MGRCACLSTCSASRAPLEHPRFAEVGRRRTAKLLDNREAAAAPACGCSVISCAREKLCRQAARKGKFCLGASSIGKGRRESKSNEAQKSVVALRAAYRV